MRNLPRIAPKGKSKDIKDIGFGSIPSEVTDDRSILRKMGDATKKLTDDIEDKGLGGVADEINRELNRFSLGDRAGCKVVEGIELTTGFNTPIPHNLKITPKYMIILRQSGSGSVFDGTSPWTDKTIYIESSADITVTILIVGV